MHSVELKGHSMQRQQDGAATATIKNQEKERKKILY